MKQFIIAFVFILLKASGGFSQQNNSLTFEPLAVVNTIKTNIELVKTYFKIKNSPFYFTEMYSGNKGLFLVEEKKDSCVVYVYKGFIPSYSASKPVIYNAKFMSVNVSVVRSDENINPYEFFILFNLENRTAVTLNTAIYRSEYEEARTQRCSSVITFTNNALVVEKNCDVVVKPEEQAYCNQCIDGGIYQLNWDTLKVIPSLKSLKYTEKINTCTTIQEAKAAYPKAIVKEVLFKYSNCTQKDSIKCMEIRNNKELLFILTTNPRATNYISEVLFMSPQFNFGNINTSLTTEEVFKKYPNAKLYQDNLTSEESIKINELGIRIYFKHTKEAIGEYDRQENFKKLIRKNATIEYITLD